MLPGFRGRGVAGALMAAVEMAARSRGLSSVRVGGRASLPSNLRLYERLGYRVLSSRPYPAGSDVDITLVKDLSPAAR